jgi:hypothetical protein
MQENLQTLAYWLLCAAAAERITEIVTDGDIFAEWREFLGHLAFPILLEGQEDIRNEYISFLYRKVYKLFTCGFCFSFWASLFTSWFLPMNWHILQVFGVMFLANLTHSVFTLVSKGRVRTYDLLIKTGNQGDDDGGNGEIS